MIDDSTKPEHPMQHDIDRFEGDEATRFRRKDSHAGSDNQKRSECKDFTNPLRKEDRGEPRGAKEPQQEMGHAMLEGMNAYQEGLRKMFSEHKRSRKIVKRNGS